MDDFERFEETSLPPKDAFYSGLNGEGITDKQHRHAWDVGEKFEYKNLGDYYYLYVRTDTLLLADVFEYFRKTYLKQYGLDPAHYYTSPGLSWDTRACIWSCWRITTYIYLYKMVSGEGRRWWARDMSKQTIPTSQITTERYLWVISSTSTQIIFTAGRWVNPFQHGEFKWLTEDKNTIEQYRNDPPQFDKGVHFRSRSWIFLLAPETLIVPKEWMSPYQLKLLGDCPAPKVNKLGLTPNLRNK